MGKQPQYSIDHPDSIWLYPPNFPLAIVASVLYAIPMGIQFWQTIIRYKSYYFIVMYIGAMLEVVGYAKRAVSIKSPSEVGPYAASSSLIVIAPIFVAAGNYLLISRLCLRVLPSQYSHIFRIPVAHLTRVFISCDILTLMVQCAGTSIAASANWEGDLVRIGENVIIAGLAMQLATFTFFLIIVIKFHMLTRGPEGVQAEARIGWRSILWAVYISSGMIIIRCIFRLIEFALGVFGYPFTHEWMFYTFESIPMLPAIFIFCIWHPGKYFGPGWRRAKQPKVTEDVPLSGSERV